MSLSEEQSRAFACVRAGHNTMITGPGGCGKSYLLDRIREELPVEVCGSTGVAAVNVGGVTLHSWAGIGLGDEEPQRLLERVRANVPAYNRIRKARILAVDEVSMISAELFDKLDQVFQGVRESTDPFGGLQMVVLGDPLQLRPVRGEHVHTSRAWSSGAFRVHQLTVPFRQRDADFARALGLLRTGEMDAAAKEVLNSRSVSRAGEPPSDPPPVVVAATNAEVDAFNARRLSELKGEETSWEAVDKGTPMGLRMLGHLPVPERVTVRPGARVMCLANLDTGMGIVNGAMGTVLEASPERALVRFDHGEDRSIPFHSRKISLDGRTIGERRQVPLRLSWAVTAHKVQGCTLDRVEVRMARAFEPSQVYVAMSRARRPDGLWTRSLNPAMLRPDARSVAFLRSLEAGSRATTP